MLYCKYQRIRFLSFRNDYNPMEARPVLSPKNLVVLLYLFVCHFVYDTGIPVPGI